MKVKENIVLMQCRDAGCNVSATAGIATAKNAADYFRDYFFAFFININTRARAHARTRFASLRFASLRFASHIA
jgi:hypothetical protein